MRVVEVVLNNGQWYEGFEREAFRLKKAIGEQNINIHHIGSTAIPSIKAKPVIDMLIEVEDIERVNQYNQAFEKMGYSCMGEHGIEGRRFYHKGGDNRTHHVHVFQKGNVEIERHIRFRDYLIAHPQEAQIYSELKQNLAEKYRFDIESYIRGKHAFIQEIDQKANRWKKTDV